MRLIESHRVGNGTSYQPRHMLTLTHVWLKAGDVGSRPTSHWVSGPDLSCWYYESRKVARPPFILLAPVLPCVVRGLDPRGRASFRASYGVTVSVSARLFVYVVANPYFLPSQFKKYGG